VRSLADAVPFDIPQNWAWTRIGSLFTLQAGKNIQAADVHEEYFDDAYPCYGGNGIRGYVKKSNRCGDYPIIGRQGALCGNINRATGKFYATEHAVCVECYSGTSVAWACLFLAALNLNQYATATAQPGLAVANLNEVLIPVPPIPEQLRIVGVYESLIPYIIAYRSIAEKLQDLNVAFPESIKKSILQEAVQGKLVPQDPSDEPAEALLERIRAEKQRLIKEGKIKKDKHESVIFRRDNSHYEKLDGVERCIDDELPFEIPETWVWIQLGSIGDWGSGATPSRTHPEYYDGSIPWLKTGDLTDSYITDIPEGISQLALEKTSVRLNESGSVLMAMYGATIGKLGILTYQATTNQACCACKPVYGVETLFLFYFLMSQRTAFIKRGEGGAQPNISKEKIVTTLMPLPPLAEQQRIVQRIEELLPLVKGL